LHGVRLLGVLLDARLVTSQLPSPSPGRSRCCLEPAAHADAVLSRPATLWEALLVVAAWWVLLLLLVLSQQLLVVLQYPTCWEVRCPCTCYGFVVWCRACLAEPH
jgi:hypothetical protein